MVVTDVTSPDHPYHWMWVIYKPIDRFPHYLFGSDGSVWTRYMKGSRKGTLLENYRKMGFLDHHSQYWYIQLRTEDGLETNAVAHLICEAFHGPRPDGLLCLHGNGKRKDNRFGNLRWGTHKENLEDSRSHGTMSAGTNRKDSKLTTDQVREIVSRVASGELMRDIAVEYGVSKNYLTSVIKGVRRRQYAESSIETIDIDLRGGHRHWKAKLNWDSVVAMRADFSLGMCDKDAAEKYGISAAYANNIRNFKNWKFKK